MSIAKYDYGFYKTRERAELALEDMYCTGEISECEWPEIERRTNWTRSGHTIWVITLSAE